MYISIHIQIYNLLEEHIAHHRTSNTTGGSPFAMYAYEESVTPKFFQHFSKGENAIH